MSVLGGGGFNEVYRLAVELYVQDLGKPQMVGAMASLDAYAAKARQLSASAQAAVRSLYPPAPPPGLAERLAATQRRSFDLLTRPITVPLKFLDEATAPARAAIGAVADFAGSVFSKMFSLPALLAEGALAFTTILKPLEMASQFEQVQFQISRVTGSTQLATGELDKMQQMAMKTGVGFDLLSTAYARMRSVKIAPDMATMALQGGIGAAARYGTGEAGIQAFANMPAAVLQESVSGRSGRQVLQLERQYLIPATRILSQMWGESVLTVQSQLQNNMVPTQKLIRDLIKGVYQEYAGDVSAWSLTFKAVTGRLEEIFLWRPMRSWGRGLLDALEGPLDKISQFFDENTPQLAKFDDGLQALGHTAGDWLVQKLAPLANSLKDLFSSDQFKNADFGGQIDLIMKALIGPDFDTKKTVKNILDVADALGKIITVGAQIAVAMGSIINQLNKLGNWADAHPAWNELLKVLLGAGIGFVVGGPPGALVGAGAVAGYDAVAASANNTNPPRGQWNTVSNFSQGGSSGSGGGSTGYNSVGPGGFGGSAELPAGQAAFTKAVIPYAKEFSQKTGLPGDVFAAIAANETGWGSTGIMDKNVLYGVKWQEGSPYQHGMFDTWEEVGGKRVNQKADFETYANPAEAMQGFWDFLNRNSRYTDALAYIKQHKNEPGAGDTFVNMLKQAGYATASNWPDKVNAIAHGFDMAQGDANGMTHSAFIPAYPAKGDLASAGGGAGVTINIQSIDLGKMAGDARAQVGEFLRILSDSLDKQADNVPVAGAAYTGTP